MEEIFFLFYEKTWCELRVAGQRYHGILLNMPELKTDNSMMYSYLYKENYFFLNEFRNNIIWVCLQNFANLDPDPT